MYQESLAAPQRKVLLSGKKEVTPDNLAEALAQAIGIEIATIPLYLYTYYSLNRSPDQEAMQAAIVPLLEKAGLSPEEAAAKALDLSAEIMVYANKAGALIMSVVVEEMLHLALSSNVMQALCGVPELVGKSPVFPAVLPGHEPVFTMDLAPFSLDQLKTFLKIESPDEIHPDLLRAAPFPYITIGKFYEQIKHCISTCDIPFRAAPQLVPGRGYYIPNSIDTVYYDKQHRPQYANAGDSGDLIEVVDKASACTAIEIIQHQGEGNEGVEGLLPDNTPNCAAPRIRADYDDPSGEELSHFEKFAQAWCTYKELTTRLEPYGITADTVRSWFVLELPVNPKTAQYPANLQKLSTLLNAIYTYIFVMTEACYKKEGNTQYEIFIFGIHKSMIFLLNSICGFMTGQKYTNDKGVEVLAGPTFEDYAFDSASSPKAQLLALFNEAVAVYPDIQYLGTRLQDMPDVAL
ncbi:MAG: hypothetical protein EOO11_04990 [Chitinophagaceae bacterium]|nr:MAG: hypothetical protein EOO11_04990 [Chitinophagaceae bacterium]